MLFTSNWVESNIYFWFGRCESVGISKVLFSTFNSESYRQNYWQQHVTIVSMNVTVLPMLKKLANNSIGRRETGFLKTIYCFVEYRHLSEIELSQKLF
jgi:hypothetical protein